MLLLLLSWSPPIVIDHSGTPWIRTMFQVPTLQALCPPAVWQGWGLNALLGLFDYVDTNIFIGFHRYDGFCQLNLYKCPSMVLVIPITGDGDGSGKPMSEDGCLGCNGLEPPCYVLKAS